VFPRFIRGFVNKGAEVLINPSNDGWFAKTAARYQHLEIVRMRAAENQRWILRATNDGISAAIDDAGRIREQLPLYQESSKAVGFEYEKQLTLYTRWGDWFVVACAFILALSRVESLIRRRP
jgi:apolipoprotein N-acyltransferase